MKLRFSWNRVLELDKLSNFYWNFYLEKGLCRNDGFDKKR